MAGTFYSLEEVMEKLGRTEEQIKELVKDGRIREFRDGPKMLYKSSEVDALTSEIEPLPADVAAEDTDFDIEAIEPVTEVAAEDVKTVEPVAEVVAEDMETAGSVVELVPDETGEISLEPDDSMAKPEDESDKTAARTDISELTGDDNLGELTKADTNITSIGINILAETDEGYKLTEDTTGETNLAESTEELSTLGDDLSLDTAGSGSGLLDLSLQADDTSLGAVLDDILPAADQKPVKAPLEDQPPLVEDEAQVDKIFDQPDVDTDMPQDFGPATAAAARYIEPAPDSISNACGWSLFLPLIALIYAAIVIIAASQGIVPALLTSVENIIWYIAGAMAVIAIAIIGIAALLGGKKTKEKKEDVYQQTG